jgi:DNA/RNA-binding domain of Phe-tRNA-synthetase-like protein
MLQIHLSPLVSQTYPGACCGFLVLENVANPAFSSALEARKTALQEELRARYSDENAIKTDPVLQAYAAYYKRFKKTYHVALQLESVSLKGKGLPTVAALVECMFMAELNDRLLTAGHDLAAVQGSLTAGVAQGSESYTLLRGTEQALKPGDLFIQDEAGVISSIIYGPDARTQIIPTTTTALFTVYAPPGIGTERVREHLAHIAEYARVFCPEARVALDQVAE